MPTLFDLIMQRLAQAGAKTTAAMAPIMPPPPSDRADQARVAKPAGSRYWWESQPNADSERALAMRRQGLFQDTQLPPDPGK